MTQRAVLEIADQSLQIHGGYGYMREYGIERAVRDARLGPIGGGTDEIMKEILLGRWVVGPRKDASPPGLASFLA
jgi:acyl-CoA dehydrogenase